MGTSRFPRWADDGWGVNGLSPGRAAQLKRPRRSADRGYWGFRFVAELLRERRTGSLQLARKARNLMAMLFTRAEREASPEELERFQREHALARDPREYLERGQIFVTFEPDDPAPGYLPAGLGETGRRVCGFSTDYGHWDATLHGCVERVRKHALDLEHAEELLSRNALAFYGARLARRMPR